MSKKLSDWEDSLKVLVSNPILKSRQALCEKCKFHGSNKFCQVNVEYTPEFTKYRYNACPKSVWKDEWR